MADPATMRAVLFYGPGDLRLIQTPVPRAAAGEVVVKIHTALTCGTDFKAYRQGHPVLLARTPSPFGHEMAGTISEVGAGVTTLREGERVVVLNSALAIAVIFVSKARRNSAIISNCSMAPMPITFASLLTSRSTTCIRCQRT